MTTERHENATGQPGGKPPADPPRPLPVAGLIIAFAALFGAFALAVWLLSRQFAWTPEITNGVMAGGITAMVAVGASILAIQPWKARPAADWSLWWLGSATVRILFTPLALFSVYSATLLPGPAVFLGGAAGFFAALVVETSVIARAVLSATRPQRSESAASPE
jgi:integral membrane sensor domain MASE1